MDVARGPHMKKYDMTGLREMIERLPTEQLDLMLQCELEKELVDKAAVRLIMEVLEERDQNAPVEMTERIETAWEKYQAYTPVKERPRVSLGGWPMRAVAAAVLLVLLAFAVMPQNAEAEGFWERLSRWTESIFEFFVPGDEAVQTEYVFKTDNPGLQQIYDTVTGLGITDPVVPMWLPEGFVLKQCEITETPSKSFVYACLSNGRNTVILDIAIRNADSPRQYIKDEENTITHEIAGIVHTFLHNEDSHHEDWWTAAWVRDRLECAIAIDCQEETLYKILKSIYMMEAD